MDKRDHKPMSDQEKLEMDILAEAELARLQRQYRIMEGDRSAFSEEVDIKLTQQRRAIRVLREEQKNLLTDLMVATCRTNKRKDSRAAATCDHLLDRHDDLNGMLKKEKRHLSELNQQIKKLEKQVFALRKNQVSDETCRAKSVSGEKTVKALENKLETSVKRFCTVLSENKSLREEIDHLLKERASFNARWEKLLANLNQGKKYMLDLIEQGTVAYDQREEWCCKLQALRARGQNDLLIHLEEMKELQRRLDLDHKLQQFLGKKGQTRVMKDLEEKEARKKEMQQEKLERELENYKDTLEKIKAFTAEADIDKLAGQYVKQEEENFALFNYVNELNHEIETLGESIDEMEEKIDEQISLNEIRAEQQKETLETLQTDLDQATQEANNEKEKLQLAEQTLSAILDGIIRLFKTVNCDNAPILELLGSEEEINNYNAMLYLGLLERKVTELITCLYLKENTHDKKKTRGGRFKREEKDKEQQKHNVVDVFPPPTPCLF